MMVSLKKIKNAKNKPTTLLAYKNSSMPKNGSKKQLIFQKLEHFENWEKWPPCKGPRLSMMVSMAQKLKIPRTTVLTH